MGIDWTKFWWSDPLVHVGGAIRGQRGVVHRPAALSLSDRENALSQRVEGDRASLSARFLGKLSKLPAPLREASERGEQAVTDAAGLVIGAAFTTSGQDGGTQ